MVLIFFLNITLMNAIFKKLNYKDQGTLYIINSPDSFTPEMKKMEDLAEVKTTLDNAKGLTFVIAFVTKQNEVDKLAETIARKLAPDGILWFAYPKGSSKRYKCEFNRDTGWQKLGDLGFEGVRMVAIDEDWSALRFRKAEAIKKMTRSFAMSEAGRKKVAASRKSKN